MKRRIAILALSTLVALGGGSALLAQTQSGLRGTTPLDQEGPAARMTPTR